MRHCHVVDFVVVTIALHIAILSWCSLHETLIMLSTLQLCSFRETLAWEIYCGAHCTIYCRWCTLQKSQSVCLFLRSSVYCTIKS